MTSISLRKAAAHKTRVDALVVGVVKSGDGVAIAAGGEEVASAYGRSLAGTLKALRVKATVGDVAKIPGNGAVKAPVVVLVGLGDDADVPLESLRRGVGAAARALAGTGSAAFAVPADTPERVRAVGEGVLLGSYAFSRYLTRNDTAPLQDGVVLTGLARSRDAQQALSTATTVGQAVNAARDLVNAPANHLDPGSFAEQMVERAKGTKVSVEVLDEKELTRQGYGGVLGVGQGSVNPPRLVKLSYRPRRAKGHVALVGKGITFDSGGLSIKTATGMMTMKCDMSGAAAVVSATFAVAELGLPVQVTAYASLAENMPSGAATRPGDVLTMYGGKTVEVLNTDAEGRLVLADAITTANELQPDLIVDVATLTGACVVALGSKVAGVMSNDDDLLHAVPTTAERAGEAMWPLPITEDLGEKVRSSKVADLSQHNTEGHGGALYAAAFLREFVGEGIPWVHLDIAGPAFNSSSAWGYTPKGGTGAAVRTLVQLATERAGG